MTKQFYERMTQPFRDFPKLAKSVHRMNQLLTGIIALSFTGLLIALFWMKDAGLYRAIVVPLDGCLIVSAFRFFCNRQRPYEKFEIMPGIKKETKGKSFPSRHVFSAGIITFTFFVQEEPVFLAMGIVLLAVTGLVSVIRVWTGIHYPSDIFGAWIAAILTGWLGFIVI